MPPGKKQNKNKKRYCWDTELCHPNLNLNIFIFMMLVGGGIECTKESLTPKIV